MDSSPPGSSVHGIIQARILEWAAISFSRLSSQPRDWTHVSYTAGGSFTSEPCGKFRHIKTCVLLALFLWRTLTHDYRLKIQNQIRNHHPHFVFYFIIICSHEIKRHLLLGRKAGTNLDILLKSRHITLPTKVCIPKTMVFPVVMSGCESWTIKKTECWKFDTFKLWCWRRLAIPLDTKVIKPVNPKGNQPWMFIARTDAEAEAPVLWLPDAKSRLTGKDPDSGKD